MLLRALKQTSHAWSTFDFVLDFEITVPRAVDSFALLANCIIYQSTEPNSHERPLTRIDLETKRITSSQLDEEGVDILAVGLSEGEGLLVTIESYVFSISLIDALCLKTHI